MTVAMQGEEDRAAALKSLDEEIARLNLTPVRSRVDAMGRLAMALRRAELAGQAETEEWRQVAEVLKALRRMN